MTQEIPLAASYGITYSNTLNIYCKYQEVQRQVPPRLVQCLLFTKDPDTFYSSILNKLASVFMVWQHGCKILYPQYLYSIFLNNSNQMRSECKVLSSQQYLFIRECISYCMCVCTCTHLHTLGFYFSFWLELWPSLTVREAGK